MRVSTQNIYAAKDADVYQDWLNSLLKNRNHEIRVIRYRMQVEHRMKPISYIIVSIYMYVCVQFNFYVIITISFRSRDMKTINDSIYVVKSFGHRFN